MKTFKEKPTSRQGGGINSYKSIIRGNTHKHQENIAVKSFDFTAISAAALSSALPVLTRWLPGGRVQAHEYVALNPKRSDKSLGSFRINIVNGKWSDFATGDRGGDIVSLGAYLFNLSQLESAKRLNEMLGGVK